MPALVGLKRLKYMSLHFYHPSITSPAAAANNPSSAVASSSRPRSAGASSVSQSASAGKVGKVVMDKQQSQRPPVAFSSKLKVFKGRRLNESTSASSQVTLQQTVMFVSRSDGSGYTPCFVYVPLVHLQRYFRSSKGHQIKKLSLSSSSGGNGQAQCCCVVLPSYSDVHILAPPEAHSNTVPTFNFISSKLRKRSKKAFLLDPKGGLEALVHSLHDMFDSSSTLLLSNSNSSLSQYGSCSENEALRTIWKEATLRDQVLRQVSDPKLVGASWSEQQLHESCKMIQEVSVFQRLDHLSSLELAQCLISSETSVSISSPQFQDPMALIYSFLSPVWKGSLRNSCHFAFSCFNYAVYMENYPLGMFSPRLGKVDKAAFESPLTVWFPVSHSRALKPPEEKLGNIQVLHESDSHNAVTNKWEKQDWARPRGFLPQPIRETLSSTGSYHGGGINYQVRTNALTVNANSLKAIVIDLKHYFAAVPSFEAAVRRFREECAGLPLPESEEEAKKMKHCLDLLSDWRHCSSLYPLPASMFEDLKGEKSVPDNSQPQCDRIGRELRRMFVEGSDYVQPPSSERRAPGLPHRIEPCPYLRWSANMPNILDKGFGCGADGAEVFEAYYTMVRAAHVRQLLFMAKKFTKKIPDIKGISLHFRYPVGHHQQHFNYSEDGAVGKDDEESRTRGGGQQQQQWPVELHFPDGFLSNFSHVEHISFGSSVCENLVSVGAEWLSFNQKLKTVKFHSQCSRLVTIGPRWLFGNSSLRGGDSVGLDSFPKLQTVGQGWLQNSLISEKVLIFRGFSSLVAVGGCWMLDLRNKNESKNEKGTIVRTTEPMVAHFCQVVTNGSHSIDAFSKFVLLQGLFPEGKLIFPPTAGGATGNSSNNNSIFATDDVLNQSPVLDYQFRSQVMKATTTDDGSGSTDSNQGSSDDENQS